MFGTMATMPFVHSPPRFGSRDIGPIIPMGGIGRMDTGDTDRGFGEEIGWKKPSSV